MSSSVLTLTDVSVRRGDRTILGPLNFSISQGERWVVLGPNGAGKSTLLQILATKIFPTHGVVTVLDKEMGKVDLFELRTRIGLCGSVIAEDIPFDETVKDVVLTAAYAILGRWNEAYDLWDESRAMALLTNFGVRELGDRPYGTLSEGEKKRVQISRALMTDPELLLLDEPAAGLDHEEHIAFGERLRQVPTKYGVTLLIIEHDLDLVRSVTTELTVLNFGEVISSGSADVVRRDPAVIAAYLGTGA